MLEVQIQRFRLGYKICDEMVYDYMNPKNAKHPPEIHETRVSGINEQTNSWEGAGYLAAVTKNCIRHPKTMYELFFQKD